MSVTAIPVIVGLAIVAVVVFLLLAAAVLLLVFRRRPKAVSPPEPDLAIDVETLQVPTPTNEGVQLECYGTPVRLAVLVVAPVGRGAAAPTSEQLLRIVDQLLPGLVDVVDEHQPVVRVWPPQLSSQGFVNAFFHKVSLPGDRGKGTPWCGVAGKFTAAGQPFLAGLICRAADANGLSAIAIQHDGQWNDVLRIKR